MDNEKALQFFGKLVEKNSDKGVEKYGHDTTSLDAEFILRHATPGSSLLDLGSGTGLILNKIETAFGSIDAVEPIVELSRHIVVSPRIRVCNTNIFEFTPSHRYQLATLFGVMHYFNEAEARRVYALCHDWIAPGGKLIIKNQFGVQADVTVSDFSEALGMTYYAQYRHHEKEVSLLESLGFVDAQVVDIYPAECNRWNNTHFYAIVVTRP